MEEDFFNRARNRQTARDGSSTRRFIGALVVAFVLGAALIGYLAWSGTLRITADDGDQAQTLATVEPSSEPSPDASEATPTPRASEARKAVEAAQAVEKVAEQQGGLEARVVAMEQRIDQLSLQTQAASGNAARAEGLLVAFAARRAIERGAQLGYLADQLKLRFGDARPNAVQTILDVAERPVTLDQLMARLDGLAPTLSNRADEKVSWDWFTRELSGLFVVRRETAPSPQPERRLERARLFLESGRIEAAVAEVRNLPGAEEAGPWIADAERYAAAQRALDLLETTAVLEPRDLRDGSGKKVEQRSPASQTSE